MIYSKTDAGRAELQGRSRSLSPSQRQVLILCDGERHVTDLQRMVAPDALKAALEHLTTSGLLAQVEPAVAAQPADVAAEPEAQAAVELTDSERYRAVVSLATSMAADLGFAARVRAQLQIEKAQSMEDLSQVVELLFKHLNDTPRMSLRLGQLRQLTAA